MPRPHRRTRFELQLTRETDSLKTVIVGLRRQLEDKQSYARKLEYLLRVRCERIDAPIADLHRSGSKTAGSTRRMSIWRK